MTELGLAAANARRTTKVRRMGYTPHTRRAGFFLWSEPGVSGEQWSVSVSNQARPRHAPASDCPGRQSRYRPGIQPPACKTHPARRPPRAHRKSERPSSASAQVRHASGQCACSQTRGSRGRGAHSSSVTAAMTAFRFPDDPCRRSLNMSPLRRIKPSEPFSQSGLEHLDPQIRSVRAG